jgi:hypothetical protein
MTENNKPNFGDISEGISSIAVGIIIALWSWFRRPLGLRDSYSDLPFVCFKRHIFWAGNSNCCCFFC